MQVGSLCEYIGANLNDADYKMISMGFIVPNLNTPYTVRDVFEYRGNMCIRLEEIKQPISSAGFEEAYKMKCFRELQPPIPNVEQWVNDNTLELVEVNPKQ